MQARAEDFSRVEGSEKIAGIIHFVALFTLTLGRGKGRGCIDDDTSKQRIIILQTNSLIIYSVVYIHMGVLREREREI